MVEGDRWQDNGGRLDCRSNMKTIALHSVFFAGFAFIFLPCAFADIDFNREVLPILSDKCFHCHGPDNETLEADLRLDQAEHVFSERDGYRIVLPGNTEESELIRRIRSRDPDERMPPSHSTRQLSPAEIELLTNWVKEAQSGLHIGPSSRHNERRPRLSMTLNGRRRRLIASSCNDLREKG